MGERRGEGGKEEGRGREERGGKSGGKERGEGGREEGGGGWQWTSSFSFQTTESPALDLSNVVWF